jgi:hypothetical protein
VTSRPEARIRAGFDSLIREDLVQKYNLNKVPVSVSGPGTIDDITRYLKHKFSEISACNGLVAGWPGDEDIKILADRADGLFIYASIVILFLGAPGLENSYLNSRLRMICDSESLRGRGQNSLDTI